MKITAKVRCTSAVPSTDGEQVMLTFGADYLSDDGRAINAEWARYTPGCSITMGVKPEVPFEAGTSYTLTFDDGQD